MIRSCSLHPEVEENGAGMPYAKREYEGRAKLRVRVHAQIDALCRAGWTAERLKGALLAGQDVLGILPMTHAERHDFYCCVHEVTGTQPRRFIKGFMARAEAFRLLNRPAAPARTPRPVHVDAQKFAGQEMEAAWLTLAEEDLYDQAA